MSSIEFSCSHCDSHLRVPKSAAGTTGPCPKCGRRITAPSAAAESVSEGDAISEAGSAAEKVGKGDRSVDAQRQQLDEVKAQRLERNRAAKAGGALQDQKSAEAGKPRVSGVQQQYKKRQLRWLLTLWLGVGLGLAAVIIVGLKFFGGWAQENEQRDMEVADGVKTRELTEDEKIRESMIRDSLELQREMDLRAQLNERIEQEMERYREQRADYKLLRSDGSELEFGETEFDPLTRAHLLEVFRGQRLHAVAVGAADEGRLSFLLGYVEEETDEVVLAEELFEHMSRNVARRFIARELGTQDAVKVMGYMSIEVRVPNQDPAVSADYAPLRFLDIQGLTEGVRVYVPRDHVLVEYMRQEVVAGKFERKRRVTLTLRWGQREDGSEIALVEQVDFLGWPGLRDEQNELMRANDFPIAVDSSGVLVDDAQVLAEDQRLLEDAGTSVQMEDDWHQQRARVLVSIADQRVPLDVRRAGMLRRPGTDEAYAQWLQASGESLENLEWGKARLLFLRTAMNNTREVDAAMVYVQNTQDELVTIGAVLRTDNGEYRVDIDYSRQMMTRAFESFVQNPDAQPEVFLLEVIPSMRRQDDAANYAAFLMTDNAVDMQATRVFARQDGAGDTLSRGLILEDGTVGRYATLELAHEQLSEGGSRIVVQRFVCWGSRAGEVMELQLPDDLVERLDRLNQRKALPEDWGDPNVGGSAQSLAADDLRQLSQRGQDVQAAGEAAAQDLLLGELSEQQEEGEDDALEEVLEGEAEGSAASDEEDGLFTPF